MGRPFNFAVEALLTNQGANWIWQIDKPVRIVDVALSAAMAFPAGAATGFAEAFINLWLTAPGQRPQFSQDAWAYYAGPPNSLWGTDFVNPMSFIPAGVTNFGGGLPTPGGLATMILKTCAPAAANQAFSRALNVEADAGSFFVLHIDAQSGGGFPADVEASLMISTELR